MDDSQQRRSWSFHVIATEQLRDSVKKVWPEQLRDTVEKVYLVRVCHSPLIC
uniref:Uncharacterized protein n=1 Tax=Peronospora matthiolae TaxID=2874970 RepID=A0AAV1UUW0_9STRA